MWEPGIQDHSSGTRIPSGNKESKTCSQGKAIFQVMEVRPGQPLLRSKQHPYRTDAQLSKDRCGRAWEPGPGAPTRPGSASLVADRGAGLPKEEQSSWGWGLKRR